MKIQIEIHSRQAQHKLTALGRTLPQLRRNFITSISREALNRIIRRNPVDSARSRGAWVTALAGLRSPPPPGWKGLRSDPAAITTGVSEGTLTLEQQSQTTAVIATNSVPYILYIELGTSRVAPTMMVQQTLREAPAIIARTPFLRDEHT